MLQSIKNKIQAAIQLNQSNYGRSQGWWIELDGQTLGKLIKPIQIEMFWEEYKIEAVDTEKATLLNKKTTWDHLNLQFKSITLSKYAQNAYPSIPPKNQKTMRGKVAMRGLYIRPEGTLERILVKLIEIKESLVSK